MMTQKIRKTKNLLVVTLILYMAFYGLMPSLVLCIDEYGYSAIEYNHDSLSKLLNVDCDNTQEDSSLDNFHHEVCIDKPILTTSYEGRIHSDRILLLSQQTTHIPDDFITSTKSAFNAGINQIFSPQIQSTSSKSLKTIILLI